MKFIRPKKIPEANIQAEIYKRLRDRDVQCCLEYKHRISESSFIRVDVAVIYKDELLLFIECKSRKEGSKPYREGRQYINYLSSGVEFIYCMGWWDIAKTLDIAFEMLHKKRAQRL